MIKIKKCEMETNDLAVQHLKMGCHEILSDLDDQRTRTIRQIKQFFEKFYEKMPKDALNRSANEFFLDFVEFCQLNETDNAHAPSHNNMIVDDSMVDFGTARNNNTNNKGAQQHLPDDTHIIDDKSNFNNLNYLTSTVKKPNSNMLQTQKTKLDSVINEQSIIQSQEATFKAAENNSKQDLAIRIMYFLKDMSQVMRFKFNFLIKLAKITIFDQF